MSRGDHRQGTMIWRQKLTNEKMMQLTTGYVCMCVSVCLRQEKGKDPSETTACTGFSFCFFELQVVALLLLRDGESVLFWGRWDDPREADLCGCPRKLPVSSDIEEEENNCLPFVIL